MNSFGFMRLIGSLSFMIWLILAISAAAQPSSSPAPVLDSAGSPLEAGVEYYINPAITDNGGRFTLINRNGCPFNVGQENVSGLEGLPVIFTPFLEGETVIREDRDFKIVFSAATICVQSTAWKVGETDAASGRRLIVTGESQSKLATDNYFRIVKAQVGDNIYNISWCPTDVCPTCKFNCGTAGGLDENGKILLALDGNVLPVTFERRA
ncbi:kunitz type trypsin inhibitor 111-like [Corylus avellana]|uniref:kunitz type trypsin inhibitor 111-like n=1 Tax=Corylus avellana TaxID=13451 RepID=UPI00286C728F|nr:kunitz type trypsin inhibitor 111-like [Corylus avellana]